MSDMPIGKEPTISNVTVSFSVNVRIARSLMALYEMLTASPEDFQLDDSEFGTEPEEWPELWRFWIEAFMERVPNHGIGPGWDERNQRFILALQAANRAYFAEGVR